MPWALDHCLRWFLYMIKPCAILGGGSFLTLKAPIAPSCANPVTFPAVPCAIADPVAMLCFNLDYPVLTQALPPGGKTCPCLCVNNKCEYLARDLSGVSLWLQATDQLPNYKYLKPECATPITVSQDTGIHVAPCSSSTVVGVRLSLNCFAILHLLAASGV